MIQVPRSSGVLLHLTSLPSGYGIGDIGPEAHRWLATLQRCGQRAWQILPLGPTGYGNSPYQSTSSFAGNPLLISPAALVGDGFLSEEELSVYPGFSSDRIDFGPLIEVKTALLELVCQNFRLRCRQSPFLREAYEAFCRREAAWLDDFSLFTVLKKHHQQLPWTSWPQPLRDRRPEAMAEVMAGLVDEIEDARILQFLFFRQWERLRSRARELDIKLIGDIPIFVAHDSADCWARRDLFFLDPSGQPTVVAGVPPDYFSETGQRWGNPLYRWDRLQQENHGWWLARLRHILAMVDIVRIDHFRGFAGYWEIPAEDDHAMNGRWVDGPGGRFFEALQQEFGDIPIIAEDLGLITEDVHQLRDQFGLPGMRVLQFAFGADSLAEEYIPENYPENCVAYTGTHDNDTTMGLFQSQAGGDSTRTQEQIDQERRTILNYTCTDGSELNWDYIRAIARSEARLAIWPLQDVLGLGSDSRMNQPGVISDRNWTWRFTWDQLSTDLEQRLLVVTRESGRVG